MLRCHILPSCIGHWQSTPCFLLLYSTYLLSVDFIYSFSIVWLALKLVYWSTFLGGKTWGLPCHFKFWVECCSTPYPWNFVSRGPGGDHAPAREITRLIFHPRANDHDDDQTIDPLALSVCNRPAFPSRVRYRSIDVNGRCHKTRSQLGSADVSMRATDNFPKLQAALRFLFGYDNYDHTPSR
jgi:hypothetical protein